MEQNRFAPERASAPEAATDEPASPFNAVPAPETDRPLCRGAALAPADASAAAAAPPPPDRPPPARFADAAAEQAWWEGVAHGARAAGRALSGASLVPARAAMPDPDLTRTGAEPSLVSGRLSDSFTPVATDALGRGRRRDGFTGERQRLFLDALARCGVAADACRVAGVSRDTAYNLRNRAEGGAFALAWDAAILIARGRMGDELMSRGMNGVIERIYRGGELWGERHRHDNRLAMAILTRLDRQADGLGEGAPTARAIAREWDRFLDIVEQGGGHAGRFLALRILPDPAREQAQGRAERLPRDGREGAAARDLESSAAVLERAATYRDFGVGLMAECDTSDLRPARMASWTEEQWERAEGSGFLDALDEADWPEAARKETEAETNGSCPTRQDIPLGAFRMRSTYRRRFPPPPADALADEGSDVWEDDDGTWLTRYPPPEGFAGYEEREWGDEDYRRSLSPAEQAVIDEALAEVEAEEAEERAAALVAARAVRDRAFGFAGHPDEPAAATADATRHPGLGCPDENQGSASLNAAPGKVAPGRSPEADLGSGREAPARTLRRKKRLPRRRGKPKRSLARTRRTSRPERP